MSRAASTNSRSSSSRVWERIRSLWKKRERSLKRTWCRIAFHEAALWLVLPRKNSAFSGLTAGNVATRLPHADSASKSEIKGGVNRPKSPAARDTCWRAQTSSPEARSENASSSATLTMANEHSHWRTTASYNWNFSRDIAAIQSSRTLRRSERRALRLGNKTLPIVKPLLDY